MLNLLFDTPTLLGIAIGYIIVCIFFTFFSKEYGEILSKNSDVEVIRILGIIAIPIILSFFVQRNYDNSMNVFRFRYASIIAMFILYNISYF